MNRIQDRITTGDTDSEAVAEAMREHSHSLTEAADLDQLVAAVSDARYVLLGEGSPGTSEFYRWRARLTARLLREHDFLFVAVEGDWTGCYDVNRYVRHTPDTANDARTRGLRPLADVDVCRRRSSAGDRPYRSVLRGGR